METPLYVVCEGLDGTGKSTAAKGLAKALGAVLLRTPPDALEAVRPTIDACYAEDGLASQLFYASSVVHVSNEVRRLLAEGRSVVVDRYWLSTRVYDALRPGAADLSLLESRLVPAHATILFETEEGERQRRLLARGATAADLRTLTCGWTLVRRYRETLAHPIAGRSLVLDTTSRTPEECVALVVDWIRDSVRRAA